MTLVWDLVQDRIKLVHDLLFITGGMFRDVFHNSEYIERDGGLM